MSNPSTPGALPIPTEPPFLQKWTLVKFTDNEYQKWNASTFREFTTDINSKFARLDTLNTNQVRGSVFRKKYVVLDGNGNPTFDTSQVPPRFRIVGMEAVATTGVDASTAGGGVTADPIYFKLLPVATGTINALVDEEPTTTATVKCAWVRTSGTDEEKVVSYPVLPLEDARLYAGEVYQYTFPDLRPAVTRLVEVRNDLNRTQNPRPTGLDSDPYYKPFAPLTAGTGGISQAQFDGVQDQVDTLESDLVDLENEVYDHEARLETVETQLPAKADLLAGKVPVNQLPGALETAAGVVRPQRGLKLALGSRLYVRGENMWDERVVDAASTGGIAPLDAAFVIRALNPGFALASSTTPETLATHIGQLVALRAEVYAPIALGTLPDGSPKLINGGGNGLFSLQAGEWVLLRYTETGYDIVRRGSTAAPGTGGSSGPWPAFTNGVTDDVAKVFKATMPESFRTTAAEYTLDGGTTTTIASESQRSGDVLSAGVSGNKGTDQVGWRLRADAGRAAGAWLFNTAAFTAMVTNVVWASTNPNLTFSAGWTYVTDAAALGGGYWITNVLGATVTLTVPAGVTQLSMEGFKHPLGSYFTVKKNGATVAQTNQYDDNAIYNGNYLSTLPGNRLAVTPGDVIVFTRTKSDYSTDPGSAAGTNAYNYFNQTTFYP